MAYRERYSRNFFPFLLLPADIRIEVYSALLGRKTLHFNDYFPELRNGGIFLCRASMPDGALFDDGELSKVFKFGPSEFHKSLQARHARCYTNWEGLQVQFLQVCRLIYQEASMVPFKENTFTFQSPEMASHLIKRLQPWQLEAVEKAALYQQNHWRYWSRHNSILKSPSRFSLLPGLRHVRIVIDLHISELEKSCPVWRHWGDWNEKDDQDKMIEAMGNFATDKLCKVEVAILDMTWNAPLHWPAPRTTQLVAWASRIRGMLSRSTSQLDHHTRFDWASTE